VLYLAEVQKKSGFMGGGKAELKLLACQRNEQSWTAVTGDEIVSAEDASDFNSGALVFAEVTNKQIQGKPKEAGPKLVSILQNFSRFQEKFKTQEEEIEQWKQSLTYQSQELNRREMEMEARREQLEQMQEESEQLDSKRQEIEGTQAEVDRLKQEVESSRAELDAAWEQLRGQMGQVEEQQAQMAQMSVLGEEQSNYINELLTALAGAIASSDSLRDRLEAAKEKANSQQETLDGFWQQVETQRGEADRQQQEIETRSGDISTRWQQWHEFRDNLARSRAELQGMQTKLELKREIEQVQRDRISGQEELQKQLSQLSVTPAEGGGPKVDAAALENMPLNELQQRVRELQQELEKGFRFVSDQEEELTLQRQDINEIEAKRNGASGGEREQLEKELAEANESYQMQNESLVGQRRSLREKEQIMNQHQATLWRRLGTPEIASSGGQVDVSPVVNHLQGEQQKYQETLDRVCGEIEQLQQEVEQKQGEIDAQAGEQETQLNELKQQEGELTEQRSALAQLQGKLALYEELLQPVQDRLNELKQALDAVTEEINYVKETGDYQTQVIGQLQEFVGSLGDQQQAAAS